MTSPDNDLVTCAVCSLRHKPRSNGSCPRCAARAGTSTSVSGPGSTGTERASGGDDAGSLRFGALALDTIVLTACLYFGGALAYVPMTFIGGIPIIRLLVGVPLLGFGAFIPFAIYQSVMRPDQPKLHEVLWARRGLSTLPLELRITIGVAFTLAIAGGLAALKIWAMKHGAG